MFTNFSVEHLTNIRKILDDMAMQAAQLSGGAEALRLLYPSLFNTIGIDLAQATRMTIPGRGLPAGLLFGQLSQEIGEELERRARA